MKRFFLVLLLFPVAHCFSQTSNYKQENFCKNLNKVFELGRYDNFDSYDGTTVKQSAVLVVPGYAIKLENFAINYADKDHRFVAKTNENLDSLSAFKKLEELKSFVGYCLDTVQWKEWEEVNGDDANTVFLKEQKQSKAVSKDFNLSLAVLIAAPHVYTLALYVKRR